MTRAPEHCPECGFVLSDGKKPRSIDQHRRYFAVMRAAFMHWPETHERQFANAEELRAYLQMKAGHREIGAQIPLSGMSKERAMLLAEAAIRGAGSYAMPVIHGDTLVIFKPKSIRFSSLGHQAFCALNSDIDAIIEKEIGVNGDRLLKETEAAA